MFPLHPQKTYHKCSSYGTFPSFLLSFKYFLLNAGAGLTSVKSKITLWFRISNVNSGLLSIGTKTPRSSALNWLLTILVGGRISDQKLLQSWYRSYLVDDQNTHSFSAPFNCWSLWEHRFKYFLHKYLRVCRVAGSVWRTLGMCSRFERVCSP